MTRFNENILWPVFDHTTEDEGTHVFHVKKNRAVPTSSDYTVSDADSNEIRTWTQDHNKTCPLYDDGSSVGNPCGAIGGRMSYKFTPTGLGTMFVVMCACGEQLDLTDVSGW